MSPSGLRERRREQLRSELLSAAAELFEKHGFEQPSVEQITRHAGIAKGTFYLHFSSKADLVRAAIEDVITDLENELSVTASSSADPRETLSATVQAQLHFIRNRPTLARQLITGSAFASVSPEAAADLRQRFEAVTVLACERLIRLAMLGQAYSVGDADASARALWAMVSGLALQQETSDNLDEMILGLFERGMCRRAA